VNIPGIFNDSVIAEAADMNTNHLNTIIYIFVYRHSFSLPHTHVLGSRLIIPVLYNFGRLTNLNSRDRCSLAAGLPLLPAVSYTDEKEMHSQPINYSLDFVFYKWMTPLYCV
jgi:hypothetical protein